MKVKKELKEWFNALIHASVIVLLLYYLCWPVEIKGNSMEDSFFSGDRVVISKVLLWAKKIEISDVIVLKLKDNDGMKIIKRVVGLEGDHIVIKNGIVVRNGVEIKEQYKKGYTYGDIDLVIPADSVFVLGDNREHSVDSRDFGAILNSDVIGKVVIKIYPLR